jgi:hypothetical protein
LNQVNFMGDTSSVDDGSRAESELGAREF